RRTSLPRVASWRGWGFSCLGTGCGPKRCDALRNIAQPLCERSPVLCRERRDGLHRRAERLAVDADERRLHVTDQALQEDLVVAVDGAGVRPPRHLEGTGSTAC